MLVSILKGRLLNASLVLRTSSRLSHIFIAIMNAISAQMILLKCQGDEIWPEDVCLAAGIPQVWIDELVEKYESGFDTDQNTIYKDGQMVNQFQGVSDLLLAYKLADYIGIDWQRETGHIVSRTGKVDALKEALDEL